jgi:type I restriction enzyme, S subunit
MSFPAYKSHAETGIAGLGRLPAGWHVSRLGFEAWVRARLGWKGLKADEYVDDGYPMLATPNIKESQIDFDGANKITGFRFDESPEIKLSVGDVLLAKDGSTLGTVNVVRVLPTPATVNSSIAVITPSRRLDSLYLLYLFQSSYLTSLIASIKGGMGVPHLFQEDINKFYIPLPSMDEQRAVGKFLDRETAKIDALIEEQKRLIELLKEKRQAVISQAVTKGLDPNVPMKDSGVEWFGEVPAPWGVGSLTRVADRVVVGIAEAATHAYADEGTPILRSTNIRAGQIVGEILYVTDEFADGRGSKLIKAGDLVTVRTGNAGVTAVVPSNLDGCQCFTMLITSLTGSCVPEFYCYLLNSVPSQRYFLLEGWGTAQVNISVPILKALPVTVPSIAEQQAIVAHLDSVTDRLDGLVAEAEAAMALLGERRSALISAAVTGKIDVRGLAPQPEGAAA